MNWKTEHGQEYSSERFWFGAKGTTDKNSATQAAGAFQANGSYECLVSPLSPSEAVLVRKLNPAPQLHDCGRNWRDHVVRTLRQLYDDTYERNSNDVREKPEAGDGRRNLPNRIR